MVVRARRMRGEHDWVKEDQELLLRHNALEHVLVLCVVIHVILFIIQIPSQRLQAF